MTLLIALVNYVNLATARALDRAREVGVRKAVGAERRGMVGSGDRSEKIRTYNFPQNRLTDHRIGLTLHQLDFVMDGKMEPIMDALTTFYNAEKMKQQGREGSAAAD